MLIGFKGKHLSHQFIYVASAQLTLNTALNTQQLRKCKHIQTHTAFIKSKSMLPEPWVDFYTIQAHVLFPKNKRDTQRHLETKKWRKIV